jgi:hypothetical protein
MVNWKAAAVLGVLLLAAVVYAVQTRPPSSPASTASGRLIPCPPGTAVEILVSGTGPGGKVTDVRRSAPGDPWRLVQPLVAPADGTAVDALLATVDGLTSLDTLKSPPAAAQLGLDPAQETVTCTVQSGRSYTLTIGGQNFDGSGDYALVSGDARVHVIPFAAVGRLQAVLDRPPVQASPSPSGSPSPSPSA